MRLRVLFLIAALCLLAAFAPAQQMTAITSSKLFNVDKSPVTGRFCITPVSASGAPQGFTFGGGGQGTTIEKCFAVTNGVLAVGAQSPDTSVTTPTNLCIAGRLIDPKQLWSVGGVVRTWPCLQPSGATWSLDSVTISTIPALPVLQIVGPAGPQGAPGTGNITGLTSDGDSGITVTKKISAGTVSAGATTPTSLSNAGVTFPDGTIQSTKTVGGVSLPILAASRQTSKRPSYALYFNEAAFFAGSSPDAPDTSHWPDGQGQLTVTGAAGSSTLTINSVDVGLIAQYTGTTTTGETGIGAVVIRHDDGTDGVYSTSGLTSTTVTIYPTLAKSVTAKPMNNLHDSSQGQHLTRAGYYALAKYLYGLKKSDGWISEQAGASDWGPDGTFVGTPMTPLGGLAFTGQMAGSSINNGLWNSGSYTYYASHIGGVGVNAGTDGPTDPNRSWFGRTQYANSIQSNVAGQGAQHIVNLGGRSGRFVARVGVVAQNGSNPASLLTAVLTIDGKELYRNSAISGMTFISVPFEHAWAGTFQVTLNSNLITVAAVSRLHWFVWPDSESAMLNEPVFPPGSNLSVLMDSWGVFPPASIYSNAFPVGLQAANTADLKGLWTGFQNASSGGTCLYWGMSTFTSTVLPLHPDYVLSDWENNDINGNCNSYPMPVDHFAIVGGSGYTSAPTAAVSGGTGSGLVLGTPTFAGGVVTGVPVIAGGAYSAMPTVALSGGGGSGATAIGTFAMTGQSYTNGLTAFNNLILASGITPVVMSESQTASAAQHDQRANYAGALYLYITKPFVAPATPPVPPVVLTANALPHVPGDLLCASPGDTTIQPINITGGSCSGTVCTMTTALIPTAKYAYLVPGQIVGIAGSSTTGLNGGPYTITTPGTTTTVFNSATPAGAITADGTMYRWCENQSTEVSGIPFAKNTASIPAGTVTPGVPLNRRAQIAVISPSVAPSYQIGIIYNGTWLVGQGGTAAIGVASLPYQLGEVLFDVMPLAPNLLAGSVAAWTVPTTSNLSALNLATQPTSISTSGAGTITVGLAITRTALGTINTSATTGCTVAGAAGQTVTLATFNNGNATATAACTLVSSNTLVGATCVVGNKGASATAAATSATCSAGTATSASGTATLTSTLSGAPGTAYDLVSLQ